MGNANQQQLLNVLGKQTQIQGPTSISDIRGLTAPIKGPTAGKSLASAIGTGILAAGATQQLRQRGAKERRTQQKSETDLQKDRLSLVDKLEGFAKTLYKQGGLPSLQQGIESLQSSGIGEQLGPILSTLAEEDITLDLEDESGRSKIIGFSKTGQAINAGGQPVVDVDGNPVFKVIGEELEAGKTRGRETAKQIARGTSQELTKRGLVPAKTFHLNSPSFSGEIVESSDTGEPFIKLREFPKKTLEAINGINQTQEQLQKAITKMQKLGVEPDPITGRIPFIGELLIELEKSPDFKEVRADFRRIVDVYRRGITGQAAGFEEIQRIEGTVPNLDRADSETVIRTAVSLFNEIEAAKKIDLDGFERGGFDLKDLRQPRKRLRTDELEDTNSQSSSKEETLFNNEINTFLTKYGRFTPDEEKRLRSESGQ